jgi:hypothetical protein
MASKQSEIDRIIEPGMHRIDQGLYLQVRSPTSRSWIFRYRFQGTDRQLGLGFNRLWIVPAERRRA